jgi:hypothetical protein
LTIEIYRSGFAIRTRIISGGFVYKITIRLFVLMTVVLLMTASLYAQENAIVTGTVFDPSQAAVPNAQV